MSRDAPGKMVVMLRISGVEMLGSVSCFSVKLEYSPKVKLIMVINHKASFLSENVMVQFKRMPFM